MGGGAVWKVGKTCLAMHSMARVRGIHVMRVGRGMLQGMGMVPVVMHRLMLADPQ